MDAVGRIAGLEQVVTPFQPTFLPRGDHTLQIRIGQHLEEIDAPEHVDHLGGGGCGVLAHDRYGGHTLKAPRSPSWGHVPIIQQCMQIGLLRKILGLNRWEFIFMASPHGFHMGPGR